MRLICIWKTERKHENDETEKYIDMRQSSRQPCGRLGSLAAMTSREERVPYGTYRRTIQRNIVLKFCPVPTRIAGEYAFLRNCGLT